MSNLYEGDTFKQRPTSRRRRGIGSEWLTRWNEDRPVGLIPRVRTDTEVLIEIGKWNFDRCRGYVFNLRMSLCQWGSKVIIVALDTDPKLFM